MGEKKLELISVADYLAFEKDSEFKHEFRDGEIVAMAGGTINHGKVVKNITTALDTRTDGIGCETYNSEVRVYFEKTQEFCYPDTYIVCGDLQISEFDKNSVTNPILIVEVLSPGTEAYDRGDKFRKYRSLTSFKEYVLIASDKVCIETFFKQDDKSWVINTYMNSEDTIKLRSIDLEIPVTEVYRNIVWEQVENAK